MKKKDEIKKKDEDEYQYQQRVLEAIEEIDEMLNKGVMDKYEAAGLKDQIMALKNLAT
jgi:ribosomal protein S20